MVYSDSPLEIKHMENSTRAMGAYRIPVEIIFVSPSNVFSFLRFSS